MYNIERRKKATNTGLKVGGAIVALVVVAIVLALTFGKSDDKKKVAAPTTTASATGTSTAPPASVAPITVPPGATLTGDTPCPQADGSSPHTTKFAKEPPMCIDATKTYSATIDTNKGTFKVALDAKAAPKTVNSFVTLARYHFFDGVSCHRIIKDFVVQCGDPTGTGGGGPGYTFADELPASASSYVAGSLAMANSGPNTNGSQFFVVLAPNVLPTPSYSLFGKVTDGMDTTVSALAAAAGPDPDQSTGDAGGVPTKEPIMITKVTITES
jgi:peptidyl-prolyl cis-trans isomerase B (cyclophilin B)